MRQTGKTEENVKMQIINIYTGGMEAEREEGGATDRFQRQQQAFASFLDVPSPLSIPLLLGCRPADLQRALDAA